MSDKHPGVKSKEEEKKLDVKDVGVRSKNRKKNNKGNGTTSATASSRKYCTDDGTDAAIASRQRSKRRRKNKLVDTTAASSFSSSSAPPVLLTMDVFSIVLTMLAPREMYRLAFTSKALLSMLTRECVLHNAIVHGGHARRSMKEIMKLLEVKSIFIPSPVRLLRIANGRRCERDGCSNGAHHVRPGWGVFFCWNCTLNSTVGLSTSSTDEIRQVVEDNARVAAVRYSGKAFLWGVGPYRTVGGEKCGPLVSFRELSGIGAGRGGSLEDHFASLDEEQRAATAGGGAGDDPMNAMCSSSSASCTLYDSLLRCHEKALSDAAAADEQKELRWKQRQKDARAACVVRLKKIEDKLSAALDGYPWRDIATRCTWSEGNVPSASVTFDCGIVQECLAPILKAPSKGTKKKIGGIASHLVDSFGVLYGQGFTDFSFLSADKASEPYESVLREYLHREGWTPEKLLCHERADDQMVNLVREGRHLKALFHRMSDFGILDACSMVDFSSVVVPTIRANVSEADSREFVKLLWGKTFKGHICDEGWDDKSFSSGDFHDLCKRVHEEVLSLYERLCPVALEYLEYIAQPRIVDNLDKEDKDYREKEMRRLLWRDGGVLEHLINKDFRGLLKHQNDAVEMADVFETVRWMSIFFPPA